MVEKPCKAHAACVVQVIRAHRNATGRTCLHRVIRLLHLRHENEEHEVPSISKHRISDGQEGIIEVLRDDRLDLSIRNRIGPSSCHCDDPCEGDHCHADQTKPAEAVKGSRKGDEQGCDREDQEKVSST